MEKYLKKIFKVIINILLFIVILVIILVLYGVFQKIILKKSYINYFGYSFFEVASGSMSGTIEIGDMVIVKLKENDIKENDIITYLSDEEFITHRVIKVENNYLITKGDNNNSTDSPIKKDDVLGKVVKIVPNFGTWRKVAFIPRVIISVAITIIIFSAYWIIKDIDKKEKLVFKKRNYYMKNNKKLKIFIGLLILLLVLIIINIWLFSLTFSKYQTEAESKANIQYAFYILKTDYYTEEIKLGNIVPQDDKYVYAFSVSNTDGTNRLETNLEYDLVITTTTNLELSYELYLNSDYNDPNNNIITSDVIEADEDGTYFRTLKVDKEYFSYQEDEVNNYYLVVYFPSTYKNYLYQDIVESITIGIDSKQIIGNN